MSDDLAGMEEELRREMAGTFHAPKSFRPEPPMGSRHVPKEPRPGFVINTTTAWSRSTSKLVSIKQNGTEIISVSENHESGERTVTVNPSFQEKLRQLGTNLPEPSSCCPVPDLVETKDDDGTFIRVCLQCDHIQEIPALPPPPAVPWYTRLWRRFFR